MTSLGMVFLKMDHAVCAAVFTVVRGGQGSIVINHAVPLTQCHVTVGKKVLCVASGGSAQTTSPRPGHAVTKLELAQLTHGVAWPRVADIHQGGCPQPLGPPAGCWRWSAYRVSSLKALPPSMQVVTPYIGPKLAWGA